MAGKSKSKLSGVVLPAHNSLSVIYIEYIMLVYFTIRRDHRMHRSGESCRVSLTWIRFSLINWISKDTCGFLFIMHYKQIKWQKYSETNEKKNRHSFITLADVANAL